MAAYFYIAVLMVVAVTAAPPAPPRLYQQHSQHLQQNVNPLDYYLDNPEVNYYAQAQQKQGSANQAPARLETLDPDSEVELIPGAQPPQQPPQQTPVSPNLPGLIPGQGRVFIVHMPVPGTIGGYQPVYVVAAGPQGNTGYAPNGYQNAILLDPSGQAVIQSLLSYPRPGLGGLGQAGHPGLVPALVGAAPLSVNRPYDLVYQDPAIAYQSGAAPHIPEGGRGQVRLAQLIALQTQPEQPANSPRNAATDAPNPEPKRQSSQSEESKEEPRRNARPAPPHAQTRNKA